MRKWNFLVVAAVLLAGCVGLDTAGIRAKGDLPVGHLTREQISGLKTAASLGEPSLVATAARMTWESPDDAESLANYAANLSPERADEIKRAVARSLQMPQL